MFQTFKSCHLMFIYQTANNNSIKNGWTTAVALFKSPINHNKLHYCPETMYMQEFLSLQMSCFILRNVVWSCEHVKFWFIFWFIGNTKAFHSLVSRWKLRNNLELIKQQVFPAYLALRLTRCDTVMIWYRYLVEEGS